MNSGPVIRGLLDTSVLIDYRDGWPDPIRFITTVRQSRLPEFSALSAMVLVTRCLDAAELLHLRTFFTLSHIEPVTAQISRKAFAILDRLPPPARLTADDAVVAATALDRKLPLYTLDPDRFAAVPGLTVFRPY